MEATNHDHTNALAPLVPSDAPEHQPEAGEPLATGSDAPAAVVDEVPLDDTAAGGWMRAEVIAYASVQTEPFTTSDVLIDGLHMVREDGPQWKADEMAVAKILREMGYDRQQRRVHRERQNLWSKPSEPDEAPQAARDGQHVEPITAAHVEQPPLLTAAVTIIGDATDGVVPGAMPVEPVQDAGPRESASTRYQQLSARQTDIKRKLADAQRVLHFAQDARRKAALAAADGGGFAAEAAYIKAVDTDKAAAGHVEMLTAALEALGKDLIRADAERVAERRIEQCQAVRDDASKVAGYGLRIEALLKELGPLVSAYLRDVNVVYRKAWPVMNGQRECAIPMTDPISSALMGEFLRSSGLDPSFFTELTSHGMNGLLRFEPVSQVVDMQLGNITDRLVDNYWNATSPQDAYESTFMSEPETDDHDRRAVRAPVGHVGHELVPAGIFPTTRPADAEGECA